MLRGFQQPRPALAHRLCLDPFLHPTVGFLSHGINRLSAAVEEASVAFGAARAIETGFENQSCSKFSGQLADELSGG